MNRQDEPIDTTLRLSSETEVYRLASKRDDVHEDGYLNPSAFYRRRDKDVTGVSVQIAKESPRDDEGALVDPPIRPYAFVSLLVQDIVDIRVEHYELDVIARPNISSSEAEIVNIPYRHENPGAAERIADLLADRRPLLWERKSKA